MNHLQTLATELADARAAAHRPRPLAAPVLEPQIHHGLEPAADHPRPALRRGLPAAVKRHGGAAGFRVARRALRRVGKDVRHGVHGDVKVHRLEVGDGARRGRVRGAHARVAHVQRRRAQKLESVPHGDGAPVGRRLEHLAHLPQSRAKPAELATAHGHVELARHLRGVRGDGHLGARLVQVAGALLDAEGGHVHHALVVHRVLVLRAHGVQQARGELGEGRAGRGLVVGQTRGRRGEVGKVHVGVPGHALVVEHGARDNAHDRAGDALARVLRREDTLAEKSSERARRRAAAARAPGPGRTRG